MDENTIRMYLDYLQARRGAAQTENDRVVLSALEPACRIEEGDRGQKLSRAMAYNEEVLQAVPKVEWAHFYLGIGYLQQGKLQTALSHLEQTKQLGPARAATHYYLGQTYLKTAQPELAKDAFEASLRLDPRQPEAAFQVGRLSLEPLLNGTISPDSARGQERLNLALRWLKDAVSQARKQDAYFYYLGRAYLFRQTYPEAAEALQQAVALNKRQKEYAYYLAVVYRELNQINKAKKALQEVLTLDKDYGVAHQLLADLYYGEGAFDEAIPHYRAVLRLDSDNTTARRYLGQSLFELADYQQAVTELEPVAAQSQDGLFCLARSQAKLGKFEAAIATLQQLIVTFGPNADALYYLGCAQANSGLAGHPYGYEQALIAFEQCLEANPGYWQAHLQMGHVYIQLERMSEARRSYLQAQAFQPQNPVVLSALAKVAYLNGDLEQAQASLEQALRQSPNHAPTHLMLGMLYEQQRNVTQALQAYQQAGAYNLVGIIHCKKGDYGKAQDNLLKAQQAGDESDMLLSYLGFALAQNKQYEAALQAWGKLQAKHPKDRDLTLNISRLHYLLGCEEVKAGRYAEAAQAWEKYLETYPDDEKVRQNLAEVFARLAQVALQSQGGNNSKARWAFQRAFELGGDNSASAYYLALSELADQDYAAAATRLRRLLEAAPNHAGYAYHLGLALLNQNRLDEARPFLQQVLAEADDGELVFKARAVLAGLNARQGEWQAAADLLAELA